MKSILFLLMTLSLSAWGMESFCEEALENYNSCYFNCSKVMISAYSYALYSPMNTALRDHNDDRPCLEVAAKFEKIIRRISPSSLTVYRGTILTPQLQDLRVGECFQDEGFLSTSTNPEVARKFGLKQAFMMIEASSARNIAKESNIPREQEYILLPRTSLKLIKEPYYDGKLKVFSFQEVKPRDCKKIKLK